MSVGSEVGKHYSSLIINIYTPQPYKLALYVYRSLNDAPHTCQLKAKYTFSKL